MNVGLLSQNEFNFTVLTPSPNSDLNPLPLQIKLGGYCFGRNLNVILSRVKGNSSLIKSQVWKAVYEDVSQPSTFKTVIC